MKKLFWLLLGLNLLVFAYFKWGVFSVPSSSLKPEIHPEQVKLLSEQALETYPKRVVAPAENTGLTQSPQNDEDPSNELAKPTASANVKLPSKPASVATACYEWSSFNMSRVNEAVNLAEQLNIKTQINQNSVGQENVRYWIYKPPLASAEAAQTKAEELRKLGVDDFFIVQDDPKWRHAISFGVFRDEKLADKLMADLKAKGVRLLIKSTRYGGQGQAVIRLQDVTPTQLANLEKSRTRFPDAVLKEASCQ